MEQIPMELVDKLFNCMELFYGDRWLKQFTRLLTKEVYKGIWQAGLLGLSYVQIKNALVIYKRDAMQGYAMPPNHIDFFMTAKGKEMPYINYSPEKPKGNPEIARKYMDEIRSKTHPKVNVDFQKRSFL
jgi:hypothetical protein